MEEQNVYKVKKNGKSDEAKLKYTELCYSKIDKAKELLNKGDANGCVFLEVAEIYAKKANIAVPEEIELLKPKAHEVFANYNFTVAKETLETDPGGSIASLLLVEEHTELANVKLPADFESVKRMAYENGINAKIKDAEDALKADNYEGAIGLLSIAKSYAEKIKLPVPAKVEELEKKAQHIIACFSMINNVKGESKIVMEGIKRMQRSKKDV